jgi:hypothetical protein
VNSTHTHATLYRINFPPAWFTDLSLRSRHEKLSRRSQESNSDSDESNIIKFIGGKQKREAAATLGSIHTHNLYTYHIGYHLVWQKKRRNGTRNEPAQRKKQENKSRRNFLSKKKFLFSSLPLLLLSLISISTRECSPQFTDEKWRAAHKLRILKTNMNIELFASVIYRPASGSKWREHPRTARTR